MESIEQQVANYMQGAEFGDPQIKEMMAAELRQKLTEAKAEGRPLRVYCGYDVTAPDIHVGHMAILRKMRKFQDFGHDVTFLIGTFTTLIGDPSDRDEARAEALQEEVKKNAQTYADQALKILDPKKTTIRYNYEWLSKLTFADVISMASFFTVQQFLVRDRLRNRYEKNDPIWLRELLYPLAQGYDAVFLKADVQLGGTEQLFNLMAGRKLQEAFGQKPQVCLTYPVLVGTDGVERMSKSTGNYIGINEPPEDIYGKTMSISDDNIMIYFESLTDASAEEIKEMRNQLAHNQVNPMDLKKRLAKDIVTQLYSKKEAQEAEKHFEKVVQQKELPEEINKYTIPLKDIMDIISEIPEIPREIIDNAILISGKYQNVDISTLIAEKGLSKSRSEAIRLINQSAVSIDGEKISSIKIPLKKNFVIKIGKRRFAEITITD